MNIFTRLVTGKATFTLKIVSAALIGNFVVLNSANGQSAEISGSTRICKGSDASLILSFTGTAPFSYSYTDGAKTFGPFQTVQESLTLSVRPKQNTSYSLVQMSDATGIGYTSGIAAIKVDHTTAPADIYTTQVTFPETIRANAKVLVTCNEISGATNYNWTVTKGSTFEGKSGMLSTKSNAVMLHPGDLPEGQSTYEVCVYAANSCGVSNAICKRIAAGAVITSEKSTGAISLVNVYPNPVNTNTTVSFEAAINGTGVLYFYDITGKLLIEKQVQITEGINYVNCDLSSLNNGVYLMQLKTNGTLLHTSRITKN